MEPTSRRIVRLAAVALAAIAAVFVAPARAQWGELEDFTQIDAINTPLTRAGFDGYARLLALSEEQEELGLALLDGFVEGHRATLKELQQTMREITEKSRESGDFMLMSRELPEKMKGFQERMEGLEKAFFADLKALLTPEQAEAWPRVERMRRREQGLRFGMVSGAGVDVIRLVDGLDVPAGPDLRAVLDRYELEVDRALVDMEDAGKEMQDMQAGGPGMFDFEKIGESMEELRAAARRIRDINRAAARQVEPLLPEGGRAAFAREFQRRSFPRVYRESHAAKCLKATAGFADLTPDQKARVEEVRAAYERDAGAANERWAQSLEERDNKGAGSFMEMAMDMAADMGAGPSDPDSPVSRARTARREIDDAAMEKLKAALTEDQKKRLPEATPEPRGMRALFGEEALGGG